MKEKLGKQGLSRRAFLGGTGAALVGVAGFSASCKHPKPAPEREKSAGVVRDKTGPAKAENKVEKPAAQKRSTVALVRDKDVIVSGQTPDPTIIARMLDDAVAGLLDRPADQAWKELFRPDDVVGIKSNEWRFLRTPEALEMAIRNRLVGLGVAEDRMAVDDRGVLSNPVFEKATALINVRPLRTHHWAGVGSCLKNYIMFSEQPSSWHADSCANLGGVWELPVVKGKTRLNILVMLTPLFHGKGPHHFQAQYTWPYKGLIVGQDPVAVDATGVRILEAKRRIYFGKHEPLGVPPKHIRVADQKYHLGVADPGRIDVKKMGWLDEALI